MDSTDLLSSDIKILRAYQKNRWRRTNWKLKKFINFFMTLLPWFRRWSNLESRAVIHIHIKLEVAVFLLQIALLKVEKSTITGMKDNTNTEINASLQKFQIKTCFTTPESICREFSEWLSFFLYLDEYCKFTCNILCYRWEIIMAPFRDGHFTNGIRYPWESG